MYRTITHNTSNSHQLSINMTVHPCALLEVALRCEERAVQNRSHSEHTTHDGTCSSFWGVSGTWSRQGAHGTNRTMSKSVRKIGGSHDGQRELARFHN